VSNVDGAHIHDTLQGLNPETTLVIVASKTFTTIETMTNADTAKRWMGAKVANPAAQFAAVSTAGDKTAAYGIDPARVFGFEDWVGGRYSMWGPIGLALMIAVGPERVRRVPCRWPGDGPAFPDRALSRRTCR
jgi:glucose-6-phosphate isomerase